MTNGEAKKILTDLPDRIMMIELPFDIDYDYKEALKMAISALSESTEPKEDGTLVVHTKDGSKVSRVLVIGDNIFGGLYYPNPESDNKGKWIPVSERVPENTDDVLVTDGVDMFVAWYIKDNGFWKSYDEKYDENTPILAWQPLPEPYKVEKGGE